MRPVPTEDPIPGTHKQRMHVGVGEQKGRLAKPIKIIAIKIYQCFMIE